VHLAGFPGKKMWIIDWLRDVLTNFLASIGFLNKEADIILIGLDNAGKTTLLSRLANDAFEMFPPTERPRKDEFQVAGVRFRAWDLGGHEAVRQVWDDFLPTTGGVVFVVDAADADRLQECEDELSALALDTQLYGVPMAVLFNKVSSIQETAFGRSVTLVPLVVPSCHRATFRLLYLMKSFLPPWSGQLLPNEKVQHKHSAPRC